MQQDKTISTALRTDNKTPEHQLADILYEIANEDEEFKCWLITQIRAFADEIAIGKSTVVSTKSACCFHLWNISICICWCP